MQEDIILDVFDEKLIAYGESLLSILLKDRTTNKNIIWATNDYLKLGESYKAENEISIPSINGSKEKFIRPRITKSYEKQNNRTREKAEVFTPSWICNAQNNLIDEQWFGRKDVFNIQKGKLWIPIEEKIKFPNIKGRSWKDYVDARRLEISCGEAPYLVSRYDTVTGQMIELNSRIGLLDRKMRIINENVNDETEWFKWTERAFQSIYGFELQGDNLLLARENLLCTFIENLKYKFDREPTLKEIKRIATIVSWNIWQMDGITFTIPFSETRNNYEQISFFDYIEDQNNNLNNKYCKIKNWRSNTIIEYRSLVKG
ncbi:MAG: restriction endonuclease subunit M [Clostridiales bacterium]|nr:restriction endonuclease subunit M [Clostridiales bacterium]